MNTTDKHTDSRRMLLDMATGERSGYWYELLHHAETGEAGYMLHTPKQGGTWRDMPIIAYTEDAIRAYALKCMDGDAAAVDAIPTYDESRTYTDEVRDMRHMAAVLKWCKV